MWPFLLCSMPTWADYHIIRRNEPHREIHCMFADDAGGTSMTTFDPPFIFPMDEFGNRRIVMRLTSIGCLNLPCNISQQHKNNTIYVDGMPYQLRTGCYTEPGDLSREIGNILGNGGESVNLQVDNLGHVTQCGNGILFLPVRFAGKDILQSLPEMLGYATDNAPLIKIQQHECLLVRPRDVALRPCDMWGAFAQLLVRCNQLTYTEEMQQTICVLPVAAYPKGQHIFFVNSGLGLTVNDVPELRMLGLDLCDRYGRVVQFAAGRPWASVQLMAI
uniref:LO5 n=1 Tax=Sand tiger adomavirus 1 TaxID=3238819 RepID=A0AB39ACJ3_9VIRU